MAKSNPSRPPRGLSDESRGQLAKQAADLRKALEGELLPDERAAVVKVLKPLEAALDADRMEHIRAAFDDPTMPGFEACRDHCIVQGLDVVVARQAAAALKAGGGWRSPAGGVFGREPDPRGGDGGS